MWAQSILILIGVWLMASPDVMGYGGPARANNQIVGVWMATFGMIAMSECTRAMRWVNLVLGTWLVMAPFWLDYPDERAFGSIALGVASVLLALVRSPISERFGGGWSALWNGNSTMNGDR
ncbi:MAG: SPW repeat domain-containing protein [Nitrospira sp.]